MLEIEEQIRRYGTSLTAEVERIDPAVVMARRPAVRRDRVVLVGIGVVLVLAVVVSLLVAFDGTRGQDLETVGQPALPASTSSPTRDPVPTTVAPTGTVALPRLLLSQEGWKVVRADEGANVGEMTLERGDQDLELRWNEVNQYSFTVEDRRAGSDQESTVVVGGNEGVVFRYEASRQFTAIWRDADHTFELVGGPFESMEAFRTTLGTLTTVDEATWLAAMPTSVVAPDDRAAVVSEMLADIPLPPGLDVDPLRTGGVGISDRYQLGAEVTGAVACAWISRWADARRADDLETEREAVDAMASSHDWSILEEMVAEGAWSSVLWGYADAMSGDESVRGPGGDTPVDVDARSSLGCR